MNKKWDISVQKQKYRAAGEFPKVQLAGYSYSPMHPIYIWLRIK